MIIITQYHTLMRDYNEGADWILKSIHSRAASPQGGAMTSLPGIMAIAERWLNGRRKSNTAL